ncbi:MAG: hypothetical protein PUK67_02140 [Prevotellaceae bacterium]|nr:hypothetical protein [Prevotellaceae bacterium]MDY3366467.1 hypothetical protein [Prevotella sp.]
MKVVFFSLSLVLSQHWDNAIKRSEVNMKRLFLIFVMSCIYFGISSGQTLTDQIEHAYSSLDSASYIDDIILSYEKWRNKRMKESFRSFVRMMSKDKDSSDVRKQNISMYIDDFEDCKISIAQEIKNFESDVKLRTPVYVLNLKLKDERTLQVDTTRLCFNLFYFDKKYKGCLYVYCDDGGYSWQDSYFRTFSQKIGDNAPKVFRKIMRKHPKYLLFCPDLEGMNTILYVIDNDVYIYRIAQMQKYKLDDYMKNRSTIRNS